MIDLMSPPLLIFKVKSQISPLARTHMHSVFLFFSLMRTWPKVLRGSFSYQSEAMASHTDSTFNKLGMRPNSNLFYWKDWTWHRYSMANGWLLKQNLHLNAKPTHSFPSTLPDPVLSSAALFQCQRLLWFSATCSLLPPDYPYTAWSLGPAASSSEAQPTGSMRRETTGPFKRCCRGKKHLKSTICLFKKTHTLWDATGNCSKVDIPGSIK